MEYRLGNSLRIKAKGESVPLTCPSCNKAVQFGVFYNMDRRLDSEKLLACKRVYFLVCPQCAAVYTVEETKGDSFAKGQKLSIGNFDLQTLTPFKSKL